MKAPGTREPYPKLQTAHATATGAAGTAATGTAGLEAGALGFGLERVWGVWVLGIRDLGFRVQGVWVLGIRDLGFRGLEF